MGIYARQAGRLCTVVLAVAATLLTGTVPAFADPPGRAQHGDYRDFRDGRGDEHRANRDNRKDYRDGRRDRGGRHEYHEHYQWDSRDHGRSPRIIYRSSKRVYPHDRVRHYRNIVIVRPHGHWYPGYAHYYRDDDAYKWLALTAITLGILDFLNEAQQREHEAAQIAATTAPIGERIAWQQGGARGEVIATREGTSTTGRYCREFHHEVSIGGRTEQAYGTACRHPDGSWEVISIE